MTQFTPDFVEGKLLFYALSALFAKKKNRAGNKTIYLYAVKSPGLKR